LHHAHGKRLRRFLLVGITAMLVAPGAAQAHRLTTVAVDYRVRVLSAGGPGIAAATSDGGRKLELSVPPSQRVMVLGYAHEPFLRYSPAGVAVRSGSPTAEATGLGASGKKGWDLLSSGHSFSWADQRIVPAPGKKQTRWAVPLIAAGQRASLVGTSWRVAPPAAWPWILGGAVLLAAAAVLLFRVRGPFGIVLAAIAGAGAVASLTGIALAGIGSPVSRWLQVGAVAALAFGGIVLALRRPGTAVVAAGVVAIVSLLEGIAQLGIFRHGVVLSALPANAARAAVTVAVAAGVAVTAYSVLQVEPGRRQ
jgi:hypothetical protein